MESECGVQQRIRPRRGMLCAVLFALGGISTACGDATSPADVPDAFADGSAVVPDASMPQPDSGPQLCARNLDCSDGVFCNGAERCEPGAGADEHGCRAATEARCLPGQTCDEEVNRCLTQCDVSGDADGDGDDSIDCGGTDCDDADARRFPGNAEVCDNEHHDEDCDPMTFGFRDQDADGFPDAMCCNLDADEALLCGTDCDDQNGIVHPTEAESCDGLDNDCDTRIDEDVMRRFWPDVDGDGFGNGSADAVDDCMPPDGYVENGTDCDDNEARRNPSAPEVCDSIGDNDCNPETHPFDVDNDGVDDQSCGGTDCADDDATIHPGAVELCDGVDADCSEPGPWRQQDDEDADGDGHAPIGMCISDRFPADDCDDSAAHIHGRAPEHCNGIDDDCDPATSDPSDCSDPQLSTAFVLSRGDARLMHATVDAGGYVYALIFTDHDGVTIGSEAVATGWHVASFTDTGVMRWRTHLAALSPPTHTVFEEARLALTTTGHLAFLFEWWPGATGSTITINGTTHTAGVGDVSVFTGTLDTDNGAIGTAHEIPEVVASGLAPAPNGDVVVGLTTELPGNLPGGGSDLAALFRLNLDGALTATRIGGVATDAFEWGSDCTSEVVTDVARDRIYVGHTCLVSVLETPRRLYALDFQGRQQWAVDGAGTPRAVGPNGSVACERDPGIGILSAQGEVVWDGPQTFGFGQGPFRATAAMSSEFVFLTGYGGPFGLDSPRKTSILKIDSNGSMRGLHVVNALGDATVYVDQLIYRDGAVQAFVRKWDLLPDGTLIEGSLEVTDRRALVYLRLTP